MTETARAIHATWKIEAARIIGGLSRIVRDVGLAEDLAQDALMAALEQWPERGIPPKPGAWLMQTAKNKAIDRLRRDARFRRKLEELGRDAEAFAEPEAMDATVSDDVLRLIFTACHPVLPHEAQIALTLRIVCGLTTEEIANAQLVAEPAVQQRIVRAKKRLAQHGVRFEDPEPNDLTGRLGAVLQVVYLIYNEGYAASHGSSWLRLDLSDEALRLGRMLAHMLGDNGEVHGLVALMELQSSRARARVDASGEPISLPEQNRGHWDHLQIARGLKALETARRLGATLNPYYIQAAIAACHARASTPEATDWPQIAALYRLLAEMTDSPVVRLNLAVAIGMAQGPQAGLDLLAPLQDDPALKSYHLVWSARGELLHQAGRLSEARAAFKRAAAMTRNERERSALLKRAEAC